MIKPRRDCKQSSHVCGSTHNIRTIVTLKPCRDIRLSLQAASGRASHFSSDAEQSLKGPQWPRAGLCSARMRRAHLGTGSRPRGRSSRSSRPRDPPPRPRASPRPPPRPRHSARPPKFLGTLPPVTHAVVQRPVLPPQPMGARGAGAAANRRRMDSSRVLTDLHRPGRGVGIKGPGGAAPRSGPSATRRHGAQRRGECGAEPGTGSRPEGVPRCGGRREGGRLRRRRVPEHRGRGRFRSPGCREAAPAARLLTALRSRRSVPMRSLLAGPGGSSPPCLGACGGSVARAPSRRSSARNRPSPSTKRCATCCPSGSWRTCGPWRSSTGRTGARWASTRPPRRCCTPWCMTTSPTPGTCSLSSRRARWPCPARASAAARPRPLTWPWPSATTASASSSASSRPCRPSRRPSGPPTWTAGAAAAWRAARRPCTWPASWCGPSACCCCWGTAPRPACATARGTPPWTPCCSRWATRRRPTCAPSCSASTASSSSCLRTCGSPWNNNCWTTGSSGRTCWGRAGSGAWWAWLPRRCLSEPCVSWSGPLHPSTSPRLWTICRYRTS